MRIWLFCPQKEVLHCFHIILQHLKVQHFPPSEAAAWMTNFAAYLISLIIRKLSLCA